MKRVWKKAAALILLAALVLVMAVSVSAGWEPAKRGGGFLAAADSGGKAGETKVTEDGETKVTKDGEYTSKDEVALYLHTYGHLPRNYITKYEAQDLGWRGGSLEPYAPGMSLGGTRFKNYEGTLPEKEGRKYYECDIDYDGKKRNAKRIVWSDDGLIYYTEDHYESFERLY